MTSKRGNSEKARTVGSTSIILISGRFDIERTINDALVGLQQKKRLNVLSLRFIPGACM